jgi:N-acetyl-anhydromuramyl-L-alanine amidase AmpD
MATKPPVVWYPASPANYTASNRPYSHRITKIIIHVTQGSWSSAINWFENPNAQVSAHYVVRSSDGKIAQCVSDRNIAWHAGNWPVNVHSIGIEHEGYFNDPSWFTAVMYRHSARLVAYLCHRYGIPPNRHHILGHNQVAYTRCPGPYWWWHYYMRRVRHFYYWG